MEQRRYWDVGTLATALATAEPVASGQMGVSLLTGPETEPVIRLTLHALGDLEILVGVEGLEVQASVALVPVSDIADAPRFEHQLLRANKLLPLSTFGITTIGGREHYEIFGQMSGASRIDEVIEEIETLGRNALDAAEMIEVWKAEHGGGRPA